jgi:hypothetical protein
MLIGLGLLAELGRNSNFGGARWMGDGGAAAQEGPKWIGLNEHTAMRRLH